MCLKPPLPRIPNHSGERAKHNLCTQLPKPPPTILHGSPLPFDGRPYLSLRLAPIRRAPTCVDNHDISARTLGPYGTPPGALAICPEHLFPVSPRESDPGGAIHFGAILNPWPHGPETRPVVPNIQGSPDIAEPTQIALGTLKRPTISFYFFQE